MAPPSSSSDPSSPISPSSSSSSTSSSLCTKPLLFSACEFRRLATTYKTPFHVYDAQSIRQRCRDLKEAFSWLKEKTDNPSSCFRNFFAVKANPNPYILRLLAEEECLGADCSSLPELLLAQSVGMTGEDVFFTSNNTPLSEFLYAKKIGAILNLDDISHLYFLEEQLKASESQREQEGGGMKGHHDKASHAQQHHGLPSILSFRYNPGQERSLMDEENRCFIGNPHEAKYGLTKSQLFEGLAYAKKNGVSRFCLHTMIISNCIYTPDLVQTAKMMFTLAVEVYQQLNIHIELINLGGGLGIPYRPNERPLDLTSLSAEIKRLYETILEANGLKAIKLAFECGRYITAESGCLVTRVIHQKDTYKKYIGVDACMANLMRPGMYGAYHHITAIPDRERSFPHLPSNRNLFKKKELVHEKDGDKQTQEEGGENKDKIKCRKVQRVYDVVGGLCENNDKFAVDREFEEDVEIGDLLVIHDTGAHGHCMGFNYNGKLRSAEYLRHGENDYTEIRRREEISDLFATVSSFPGLSDLVANSNAVDTHLFKHLERKNLNGKKFENGYPPSHAPSVLRSRASES